MDFTRILSKPIRWPTEGDVLFAPSPTGEHTPIKQRPHDRLRYMIEGYRRSADYLIERAISDRSEDEKLIYPIIFLYRHLIELSLKELIETFGPRANVKPERRKHHLMKLWRKYQQICVSFDVADEDEAAMHMTTIIAEFDELDPGSFHFRYHVDTDGNTVDLKHPAVDLVRLGDVMTGVANYFGGSYSYLWDRESYIRDYEAEQKAEWQSQYRE